MSAVVSVRQWPVRTGGWCGRKLRASREPPGEDAGDQGQEPGSLNPRAAPGALHETSTPQSHRAAGRPHYDVAEADEEPESPPPSRRH